MTNDPDMDVRDEAPCISDAERATPAVMSGDKDVPPTSVGEGAAVQRGDMVAVVGTTTRVYADCLLPNDALIESPAHLPFYPATARDTLRCRPGRDAALAIVAMDALGRDVRTPLLRWLRERAAGFADDGLLRRAYHVHGPVANPQPDLIGTATLLHAINRRPDRAGSDIAQSVSRGLASALAVRWDGRAFREYPAVSGLAHAADLAATEHALRVAGEALAVHEWVRLAESMVEHREAAVQQAVAGSDGDDRDDAVAAYLALAWPFGGDDGERIGRFARLAEKSVGLHGHQAETHEPGSDRHVPLRAGDGLRPAELFWLALAFADAGERGAAERYHARALDLADDAGHFPEILDPAIPDASPRPYLLAHLLFLVATDALGQLGSLPGSESSASRQS